MHLNLGGFEWSGFAFNSCSVFYSFLRLLHEGWRLISFRNLPVTALGGADAAHKACFF